MGFYTQSSETSIDDGTLSAVYDIADASTLMEAVVKIRGEHTIDYYSLTLLDNGGITINCSAEATYSAYSDETIIVIKPRGSNNIGGAGNTWKIEGPMTIEGVAMAISIKAPVPEPVTLIVTPTPPVNLNNANIVLRKSDGSDFTAEEIAGLQITMQGEGLLTLIESSSNYVWSDKNPGPNFFGLVKAETYGSEITLINGGYGQNLLSVALSS